MPYIFVKNLLHINIEIENDTIFPGCYSIILMVVGKDYDVYCGNVHKFKIHMSSDNLEVNAKSLCSESRIEAKVKKPKYGLARNTCEYVLKIYFPEGMIELDTYSPDYMYNDNITIPTFTVLPSLDLNNNIVRFPFRQQFSSDYETSETDDDLPPLIDDDYDDLPPLIDDI